MIATATNPRQLARQVGECVECDYGSTVVRATRLVAGAGSAAPEGGVRFFGEVATTAGAFILGQVLNFGSLAYIADCYSKLHPLMETMPADNESLASCPPPGLLGADL
jgi:hypothetical protein